MFGELVGVWHVAQWLGAGSPSSVDLVELGPGTGAMMVDILRAFGQFPGLSEAVAVHMVEVSPEMRRLQHRKLTGERRPSAPVVQRRSQGAAAAGSAPEGDAAVTSAVTAAGVPVAWHSRIEDVPVGR